MEIVVREMGGLGNQMFQYAAGLYYAQRYGAEMSLTVEPDRNSLSHGYPRPFLLSNFCISKPWHIRSRANSFIQRAARRSNVADTVLKLVGIEFLTEREADYYKFQEDLNITAGTRRVHLEGYFQTSRLVDSVSEMLRKEFSFRNEATGVNRELLDQISDTTNAVSLHIRRGDYTVAKSNMALLPLSYYECSIRQMSDRIADPTFFVFSDDMDFARQNLPRDINAVYVGHNDGSHADEDLRLMSSCRHHIIANSTFSWWGAWLNARNNKIVISPKLWGLAPGHYYPELLPSDWTLEDS